MIYSFFESKCASSKSYLYGRSFRNAPRATKIHFFLRYKHHDPLWRTGSFSPVLQILGPSPLRPTLCALAKLFPPQLPSSRSILGACLCDRGWHRAHRKCPKPDSALRRELWWLPAEWVKRGNRNYLRLPARYPQQELFRKIQSAASRVQPLI